MVRLHSNDRAPCGSYRLRYPALSQQRVPVKRPAYSVLDKTKIKAIFGLTIPYWLDSLEKCINLIKAAQA